MSQLANFNDATAYNQFPALNISDAEAQAKSSPSLGDPGFIVEFPNGSWSWEPNIPAARSVAGNTGAIYQSWEVCDYFRQFAEEATIDPKTGQETLEGPLQ